MDNRPIGVFDSGLGGLTAVKVLREILPGENIVYFGDTARCPYGKKSREIIRSMTQDIIGYLMEYDPKALFAACGTISVNAGDVITSFGLPSVNVYYPAIDSISRVGGERPLAVIATEASIKTHSFEDGIRQACPGREVIAIPCQNFVSLCESGHISREDKELKKAVSEYLAPVKEAKAAAMILGCTHFGIIADAISDFLGPDTELISASGSAAHEMKRLLAEKNMMCGQAEGNARYFTSGDAEEFAGLARRITGLEIRAKTVEMPDRGK